MSVLFAVCYLGVVGLSLLIARSFKSTELAAGQFTRSYLVEDTAQYKTTISVGSDLPPTYMLRCGVMGDTILMFGRDTLAFIKPGGRWVYKDAKRAFHGAIHVIKFQAYWDSVHHAKYNCVEVARIKTDTGFGIINWFKVDDLPH